MKAEPVHMTLHIENLLPAAVTDCLVALELCRERGLFDDEQLERLAPLVACMRLQADKSVRYVGEWHGGGLEITEPLDFDGVTDES